MKLLRGTMAVLVAASIITSSASMSDDNRRGPRGHRDRGNPRDLGHWGDRINNDWTRDFIGTPSFSLRDDAKMGEHRRFVNDRARRLETISQKVDAQETVVKNIEANLADKKSKRQTMIDKSATDAAKKITLKAEKKQVKDKIATINDSLATANLALQQAKTEVANATTANNAAAGKIAQIKQRLAKVKAECAATPAPNCAQRIAKIEGNLANARAAAQTAAQTLKAKQAQQQQVEAGIAKKQKRLNANQNRLVAIDREATQLDADIAARAIKVATLTVKIKELKNQFNVESPKLDQLIAREQQAAVAFRNAKRDAKDYRERLITRVLQINREAAQLGANAGGQDGSELASQLGNFEGASDGEGDGHNDGTAAGMAREDAAGYAQGLLNGADRAESEGDRVGTPQGRRQGNIDAATAKAEFDGANRAERSDAAAVGKDQGEKAGMIRAIETGKRDGTANGEAQAVAKYENKELAKKEIKGKFMGAFSYQVPVYPGPTNSRYNTNGSSRYRRRIVQLAYIDGYSYSYKVNSRTSFNNIIETVYSTAYNRAYSIAERRALDLYYQASYDAGETRGNNFAFNRDYEGRRQFYFGEARRQYAANPETGSQEYTSTYTAVEQETYDNVYEAIRLREFNIAEPATFNANIVEQTEIYRKKRFDIVEAIYVGNPVLEFVKTGRQDAGLKGVAAKDRVYQPGETILHHLVVKNYGVAAASKASIKLNGVSFEVPAISGESSVTILGVAQSTVSEQASVGSQIRNSYSLVSPLTAEAKIQGRHYRSAAQGLVAADQQDLTVQYPLSLSGLSTNGELVVNEDNTLSVTLNNNSKRAYEGALKIELSVSSNSEIMKTRYADVNALNLGQALTLKDATVLVQDPSDYFQMVSFNAKVTKNGVTLGFLNSPFSIMAKEVYKDKAGVPVVIANANRSTTDLLDVIAESGGIDQVSVLDLSLTGRNAQVLRDGLKNKIALALESGSGQTVRDMRGLLQNSENLALIFTDDHAQGLNIFKQDEMAKDATAMEIRMAGFGERFRMLFTNKFQVKSLKDSTVAIQADLKNFKSFYGLANKLIEEPKNIISRINTNTDEATYFAPSVELSQDFHVLHARNMAEIMNINVAYDKSGSRGNRNKAYREMITNDQNLISNQFKNILGTQKKVASGKLGITMAAINFAHTTRYAMADYDPMSKPMMSKIQDRVQDIMKTIEKNSEKALKKYNKTLQKATIKERALHRPFINR